MYTVRPIAASQDRSGTHPRRPLPCCARDRVPDKNNIQYCSTAGKDMYMKSRSVCPLLMSLGFIAVAGADEFTPPPMKDGLWMVHTTQTQQGKTVQDLSMKMCKAKETSNPMKAAGTEERKKNECTAKITRPAANTVIEEDHCAKGPNAGAVNKLTYTYQGDTAYHMEMLLNGKDTATGMVMDGKYLGSCPAGMKPGNVLMPDGKIIGG
jgi:uncharacterized protein DUF3617